MKPMLAPERSEIRHFAEYFHQDFVLYKDVFMEEVKIYIDSLSVRRREELIDQLIAFILEHLGKTHDQVVEEWYKLGADYWHPDYNILEILRNCVVRLHGPPRPNPSDTPGVV